MPPRPDQAAREAFQQRIRDARTRREEQVQQAEREFWQTVDAEIEAGYFGAQRDAAEALDFTRDHVAKQTKRYRTEK